MSDSSSDDDAGRTVVIDAGAASCKAGFAGEENPDVVFPCLVGYTQPEGADSKMRTYVGDDVRDRWDQLKTIRFPIEHCIVTDWDGMETVWQHSFDRLQVKADEQPVLLTEPTRNTKGIREKMTETMFEKFNVPALFISKQPIMSLFAAGSLTGLVLDCGEGVTNAVPVYEGYHLPHAVQHIDIGGRNVTSYLRTLLNERGYDLSAAMERDIVREIKQKLCYVALDYNEAMQNASTSNANEGKYELPDGRSVVINKERFMCPETLFQPNLMGAEFPGIQSLAQFSILKCDASIQQALCGEVLLSGGASMFPGTAERLEKELLALLAQGSKVKVLAPPNRSMSAWKGGAMLASLSTFKQMCMSKDEYDEYGPFRMHQKMQ